MTDASGTGGSRAAAKRLLRPFVGPLVRLRNDVNALLEQQAELSARVEQVGRAQDRLVAYQDRFVEELRAEYAELASASVGARAMLDVLADRGDEGGAGAALRRELDHAADRAIESFRGDLLDVNQAIADLRSSNRLTQAMVERAASGVGAPGDSDGGAAPDVGVRRVASEASTPDPAFRHPVPSFDTLYRSFEDRHRGSITEIHDRQRDDYLKLLRSLPHDELPVVDLGCGRGELVDLLRHEGVDALGVDENVGQVMDGDASRFVHDDLFAWLDARDDESVRAVTSLHVVEHLPIDLQVRLVFEARRVLAPGGVLVLETPNVQSLAVGASNFWVDPTHVRPVHPLFLTYLFEEAGFTEVAATPLHPVAAEFRGPAELSSLLDDLNSLVLGPGDVAVMGRR
jgi:SAM-dependent methyltransferase